MSIFTSKTGLSILKTYSPAGREKAKATVINKVRFALPKGKGITEIIQSVLSTGNYVAYLEFVSFLEEATLSDSDFLRIISEARENVHLLQPKFSVLVETLLSLEWRSRDKEAVREFCEFNVNLLVAHNKYTPFAISKLISNWVPADKDEHQWQKEDHMDDVHSLLDRLLKVIPMSFHVVLDAIESQHPYFKKPAHVIGGYLRNILRLLEYQPAFTSHLIKLIFKKLLLLDVSAPRNEIEDAEFEEEDTEDDAMFPIEGFDDKEDDKKMRHPIAETLDICMEQLFAFIQKFTASRNTADVSSFFKIFFTVFDDVILPSHNTHHVQFLIFYFCSLKPFLGQRFLNNLWAKVSDPNISPPIRQACIGYIASFLARANFISLEVLRNCLAEMHSWTCQYIQQCDSMRTNMSLKANIVFFSVCQAIFYVIAFRSKDLTRDKKSLLFLQSLHLSALVTSNFNPLRVCIPAVATAFAGVTRTYQLAYCHAVLERNARRKLATVYAHETSMPEETLETFFPFDPYLLKKSGQKITQIYLQYQPNESEDDTAHVDPNLRRKRVDSEVDDFDDFIVDKKQRLNELSRSHDKELQFTYGLSPGFHV